MAELIIKTKKIVDNIRKINDHLEGTGIEWSLIVKILSGHRNVLEKILSTEEILRVHSIGDSRLSSLRMVKRINPELVTMYIKPPAVNLAASVVKYADISVNTSFEAIQALSAQAVKQDKKHRVIIMIELGELREGIMRENVVDFYKKVFELPNIEIIGFGSNLGCMYGVEPTFDKLIQLSLYKQLVESTFDRKLDLISGGSSITLPLVKNKKIPPSVNHFRVGEAVFFGTTPLTGKKWENLSTDIFTYEANILELEEKEYVPDGVISDGNIGHTMDYEKYEEHEKSYKAILDFGIIDVDVDELSPKSNSIKFFGTTSDLTVFDVGKNITKNNRPIYKVGGKISFKPSYMGAARLMNSKFIDKKII